MQSLMQVGGNVSFPAFTGERVHMQKFHMQKGLPPHLVRWQDTVDSMLQGVDTDNPIFIMIDQGHVRAGGLHRRPRPHIDGYWIEGIGAHGPSEGGRHVPEPIPTGRHSGSPSAHRFRPDTPSAPGAHSVRPRHCMSTDAWGKDYWDHSLTKPEAIILASNVQACRGYIGEWSGEIGDGGDMAHMDLSHMQQVMLEPHRVYTGNVGFIHETLPIAHACDRTLVRLNIKDWEPAGFTH